MNINTSLKSILTDANRRAWHQVIELFAKIPAIRINPGVMTSYEPDVWPSAFDVHDHFTTRQLISYKNVELSLALMIGVNQLVKVVFGDKSALNGLVEQQQWFTRPGSDDDDRVYVPILSFFSEVSDLPNFNLDEREGPQLDKEAVAKKFGTSELRFREIGFSHYLGPDSVRELQLNLEKKYQAILKAQQKEGLVKDRMYERYLKNRWPVVKAWKETNGTKKGLSNSIYPT